MEGFDGDTLASALLANGVSVAGRSFRFHRPRGIMAAGLEEPCALVQLDRQGVSIPNIKSTTIRLYDGLEANFVNAWPSVKIDALAGLNLVRRFLPAGFYYKTFKTPSWSFFEDPIRRVAGLGYAPETDDNSKFEIRHTDCDVLVVGAGPSGLAAAKAAADAGADVILVDADWQPGGTLLASPSGIGVSPPHEGVRVLLQSLAFGVYDHGYVGINQLVDPYSPSEEHIDVAERQWRVRARAIVLATGTYDRPFVHAGNDRPGVMLLSAAETYVHRYAVSPGRAVAVCGRADSVYASTLDLARSGTPVSLLVDIRNNGTREFDALLAACGVEILRGHAPVGTRGRFAGLSNIAFAQVDSEGRVISAPILKRECDSLIARAGFMPNLGLWTMAGGGVRFDPVLCTYVPELEGPHSQVPIFVVGAASGEQNFTKQLEFAHQAGEEAARGLRGRAVGLKQIQCSEDEAKPISDVFWIDADEQVSKLEDAFVDFQNDVTAADLALAVQEGFRSIEHVKRYTTLGMAVDQGKTSGLNGPAIVARCLDVSPDRVGRTKLRPPFEPVTIAAFAGPDVGTGLDPARRMPTHHIHEQLDAQLEDYGGWLRPAFYRQTGKLESEIIIDEAQRVRKTGGVFDASPLGKLEVSGPDAAEFLNRVYVNRMKTLSVGKCRYGLMLDEFGTIIDDGVLARMSKDHFLVGTTSGNAQRIHDHLEEWLQCEWADLRVFVENVTSCWATFAIAGPRSRHLLAQLDQGFARAIERLSHMEFCETSFLGLRARVQRVSFTGELSFEISVPADRAEQTLASIIESGRALEIFPFGVESLMVLRIEKGFLHIGSETDGTTCPDDIGFGGIVQKKPEDFIGRRSLDLAEFRRTDRRQLVGIEPVRHDDKLVAGAHIVGLDRGAKPESQGWVSSAAVSPALGHSVGLAMLNMGRERINEIVEVLNQGKKIRARITSPCHFDPEGVRLND
jgi:sarcosine oxidase subunit alpha